jgi:hypothetical protein
MVGGYYIMSWAVERYVHMQRSPKDKILTPITEASTSTPRLVAPSTAMRRSKLVDSENATMADMLD